MHGHQIRRAAQTDRTELWADVKPGSIYGVLRRMATDGLVEAVRTERAGNFPARTVYAITAAGRRCFLDLRDQALSKVQLPPDPVDLALANTEDLTEPQLRTLLEARRTAIVQTQAFWADLGQVAEPHLSAVERLGFRHTLVRLQAEREWHDELLEQLSAALERDRAAKETVAGSRS